MPLPACILKENSLPLPAYAYFCCLTSQRGFQGEIARQHACWQQGEISQHKFDFVVHADSRSIPRFCSIFGTCRFQHAKTFKIYRNEACWRQDNKQRNYEECMLSAGLLTACISTSMQTEGVKSEYNPPVTPSNVGPWLEEAVSPTLYHAGGGRCKMSGWNFFDFQGGLKI